MSETVPIYNNIEQQSENSELTVMTFKEFLDLRKVYYKVKKNGEPSIRSKQIKALQREYNTMNMKKVIDAGISYSKTNDDGSIISRIVKCNNCEAVHNVVDFCTSELHPGKDQSSVIPTTEEISLSLPERLVSVLSKLECLSIAKIMILFLKPC